MADQGSNSLAGHGVAQLTSVTVDTYNAELRDKDGFVGDKASRRAFRAIVEDWRERLSGDDPMGKAETDKISNYWLRVSTQVGPTSNILTSRGFGAAARFATGSLFFGG
jgi:hypothetical protein